jgi:hypothetical protein
MDARPSLIDDSNVQSKAPPARTKGDEAAIEQAEDLGLAFVAGILIWRAWKPCKQI